MSPKELKYGKNIESSIYFSKQLDNLGIYRKYTGYYLLVEIVKILVNEENKIISFSKKIYPYVASKYGKTDCTVERNIRSLIQKCWNLELMKKLQTFYPENVRPTCREFVYLIVKYIEDQIL